MGRMLDTCGISRDPGDFFVLAYNTSYVNLPDHSIYLCSRISTKAKNSGSSIYPLG